ncbi:MAG: hypothetical protein LBR23_06470 [Spirochaetaceae bacterium]|jgi:hypothetical protein|nr:hypothetical protein [Spirochaetaceae bacterium]
MPKVILPFKVSLFLCAALVSAQSLPLYQLPGNIPSQEESAAFFQHPLVATESGLYQIVGNNTPIPLWTEGRVTDIARVVENGREKWFFVTEKGLYSSVDCRTFQPCGDGLPHLVIKEYDGKTTKLVAQAQSLKGIGIHPENPQIMAVATKDYVFLTRDGGKRWQNLGYGARSSGTKAIAVANLPAKTGKRGAESELVVFLSHALYGLSYIKPDDPKPKWVDIVSNFEKMPTMGYADEISSILPVIQRDPDGEPRTEIFLAQTFMPRIYRLDWDRKTAVKIYQGDAMPDTIDGLVWTGNNLLYTKPGGLSLVNITTGANAGEPAEMRNWIRALQKVPEPVYAAYIPKNRSGYADGLILRELWLLKPQKVYSPYSDAAKNRRSLYMPANRGATAAGINEYIGLVEKNKLNSIVIDMKDDYGLLRYRPKDELIKEKAYVSQYAINIEDFTSRFKARDIYLIARIVVFKDKNLSQYGKGRYAVWNTRTNTQWIGIKGTVEEPGPGGILHTKTDYYDEHWVDPYSEEVWEYNVRIAQELIREGFDEIQFDYIRFPTDGLNLYQAGYRWKSEGMDMESALISFLKYARKNIQAPIGIDIYGSNGWYRSGSRTGQDVELLSDYVDIICPMFYPSHFEQPFLAQSPAELRPYRIYYFGSYRNTVIARNKVIVRPWVQAFYLAVSYDRVYYNPRYIVYEAYGVRDSIDRGFMYWNNSGRYEDLVPGAPEGAEYPGPERGADTPFREPSL